jgi:histidinol-phosphate aminotransferase
VLVVLDEAYNEYLAPDLRADSVKWLKRHPNLVITRTFSKAYGLAGLRIGYMASNLKMADRMQRVKIPYSLNRISEMAATAALKNPEYVDRAIDLVRRERDRLSHGLEALGFRTYPSESNFILFKSMRPSAELVARLADKGVLIRDFGKLRMLEDCVRTTIGTADLNDLLLSKLKEVLEEW